MKLVLVLDDGEEFDSLDGVEYMDNIDNESSVSRMGVRVMEMIRNAKDQLVIEQRRKDEYYAKHPDERP